MPLINARRKMIGNKRWILGLIVVVAIGSGFIVLDFIHSREKTQSDQKQVASAFTGLTEGTTSTPELLSCSGQQITQEQAKKIVADLPEVKDFLKRMEKAKVQTIIEATPRDGHNDFSVQVAGLEQDHTASFNSYLLNKCGKVKCSFVKYDSNGNKIEVSELNEYPCQ